MALSGGLGNPYCCLASGVADFMFKKILIANRGEIACRIIKTARRMGIATVAVYSDADRDALHVEMADEAVPSARRRPRRPISSIEKIIEACKADRRRGGASRLRLPVRARGLRAGAGGGRHRLHRPEAARHRAPWATRSNRRNSPPRPRSRTVPGQLGVIEDAAAGRQDRRRDRLSGDDQGLRRRRRQGHAHRLCRTPRSREGFERARSEAQCSFGDDRVFIEKFIVDPRHIEIQVLGDKHGNCHPSRRARMLDPAPQPEGGRGGAVALPRRGDTRAPWARRRSRSPRPSATSRAGTVEFIVDQDRNFYFLEMNTRLQVEHPVTELITGIDLVEQMIRVAAGEPLAIRQEDVEAERLGRREPHLCRGPVPQFPALDRPPDALPAAGRGALRRRHRAQRHRRLRKAARFRCSTIR